MKRTARFIEETKHGRRVGLAMLLAGLPLLLGGCDEVWVVEPEPCGEAHAPVELYSVTGDGEVYLFWTPVAERYVDTFVVYRATQPDGLYHEIGHTRGDSFVDQKVRNGRTYFYAVSAVDHCGYETDLSREIAFDTPRPEGFDAEMFDANGNNWRRSGWEFRSYRAVPWDYPGADIYFIQVDGVAFLVAADLDTDIQDAGYASFDDVSWAPEYGWSPTGTVEAIPGHVYVVWTRDNHFAKVRVLDVHNDCLVFDWGYQVDNGNPELAPRPHRLNSPLPTPGSRSLPGSLSEDGVRRETTNEEA
jgi:hypothetical protein